LSAQSRTTLAGAGAAASPVGATGGDVSGRAAENAIAVVAAYGASDGTLYENWRPTVPAASSSPIVAAPPSSYAPVSNDVSWYWNVTSPVVSARIASNVASPGTA
jgi:hypothetical protein